MEDKIEEAIGLIIARIRPNIQPTEAMQFSQAVYNLAHARGYFVGQEEEPKPRRGRPPKVAADEGIGG